jgi:hypothetical protein
MYGSKVDLSSHSKKMSGWTNEGIHPELYRQWQRKKEAFGLPLHAAGAGLRVYIAQFIKLMKYSEMNSLAKPEDVELVITGRAADLRIIEAPEMTCGKFEKIKKRCAKNYRVRDQIKYSVFVFSPDPRHLNPEFAWRNNAGNIH